MEKNKNLNEEATTDKNNPLNKDNKERLPVPRLFIYPEDIARMTGWKMSHATGLYYRIRRKLKKKKGGEVTWDEYCDYAQVWKEQVLPYMHMPLSLKILLISLLLFSFSRVIVNRFPQLRTFFDEQKIEWKESLPGYQKGTMKMKNPDTGKPETVTIEVEQLSN